jgi:citrate synthase
MKTKTAEDIVQDAAAWWSTSIIDIHPGEIHVRGYPIQELIGRLSFPQMIWLMVRGELPSRGEADLLEAALVASVDHGPHAPSIAISRMAITCGLPLNGAMASAINVLDDVHGGAGQQCMELYEEVVRRAGGEPARAEHIEAALEWYFEQHGRIVGGFGHRWHPLDPRSPRLLGLVRDAAAKGIVSGRYARIGELIEEALTRRKGKTIPMNIDGATAVIYSELGFPPALGRGLFILSRSVGILAHAWEEMGEGRRIKGPMPKSIPFRYTGTPERHLEGEAKERTHA